jgi:cytochrome c-type biogenesis protein CcmH/NrfG
MTKPDSQVLRIQLVVAFLCVALVVYFWMLGRSGVILMQSGKPAAIGLGIGIFVLPLVGLWAMIATLRAGFAHQRLARLAHEDGTELDVSRLPTRPSGRIERDAADALFETVRDEVEADPDNWRRWYRLARAYDYAGDRTRARETIRKAVALERASRGRA